MTSVSLVKKKKVSIIFWNDDLFLFSVYFYHVTWPIKPIRWIKSKCLLFICRECPINHFYTDKYDNHVPFWVKLGLVNKNCRLCYEKGLQSECSSQQPLQGVGWWKYFQPTCSCDMTWIEFLKRRAAHAAEWTRSKQCTGIPWKKPWNSFRPKKTILYLKVPM